MASSLLLQNEISFIFVNFLNTNRFKKKNVMCIDLITEESIKTGQSRETGNIGYTKHKMKINKTKTQYNMC